jgi:glycosyltransferase involved in cell wall biosynthesis
MNTILHINCTDDGSTGTIITNIAKKSQLLGYRSVLCTAKLRSTLDSSEYLVKIKTSNHIEQGIWKRITLLTGYQYASAPIGTYIIKKAIKKYHPTIVHFHSANCFMCNIYDLIKYADKRGCSIVITNHAEFYYTGACPHAFNCTQWVTGCYKCETPFTSVHSLYDNSSNTWVRMKKTLNSVKSIIMTSVSPWVENRASISGISKKIKQVTILNGVDTNIYSYTPKNLDLYIDNNKSIILFVTAKFSIEIDDAKGGYFVLQLSKLLPNFLFVVVGPHNDIDLSSYNNVVMLGRINNQEILASLYSNANLSIVVSKRETFSMPVAESLSCGTPVVGFKAGGPESIALEDYSEFVEYGNIDLLKNAICKWINIKNPEYATKLSSLAGEYYSSDRMASEYNKIYADLDSKKRF